MRIAVIDGQGGGIGKAIVEKLRQKYGSSVKILALGTNSLATAAMMKAGADEGATGESAIVYNAAKADVLMGPIGILSASALMGELSPVMARAIGESPALKILIPLNKCSIQVAGVKNQSLPQLIEEAAELLKAVT